MKFSSKCSSLFKMAEYFEQECVKESPKNCIKNAQKGSDVDGSEALEKKAEESSASDSVEETNEQNSKDISSENSSSFKVPNIVQKNSKVKEPVNVETKEKAPELRYKAPWWSATPPAEPDFNLEVLKNGCIISTLNLNDKAYHVFGRLPMCDVVLEHPSISRYHALVQYRGKTEGDKTLSGFYLYDLGSTHGTIVNKSKIKAKTYYRLKVGYVIKFGGSSRLFILQGPLSEEEEENNEIMPQETTTENETKVKVGQIFTDEEYDSLKKVESKTEASEGIDWGFGEDAEEEQIDSEKFQELYSGVEFKDPKKTLRGYYEREGLELEYLVDETGPGHARVYHCKVRLPVDGPNGSAVYAEASVTGRKREAVRECANEACKMLDAYGLLRQSSHESRKKRERNLEADDFYESDEDNFLDRTGTIEKKRLKRMKKAGKEKSEVETHETLSKKLKEIENEIQVLVKRIQDAEAAEKADNGDSLEDFMNTMSERMDKQTKMKLKRKIVELRKDEEKIKKLVALTKPADLSSLQKYCSSAKTEVIDSHRDETKTEKSESADSPMVDVENKSEDDKTELIENNSKQENSNAQQPPLDIPIKQTMPESFTDFAMPNLPVRTAKPKKISKSSEDETVAQAAEEKEVSLPKSEEVQMKSELGNGESSKKFKEKTKRRENLKAVKKEKFYTAPTQWEESNDPDYASWIPPEDQSGDGKTKLNEKYGY